MLSILLALCTGGSSGSDVFDCFESESPGTFDCRLKRPMDNFGLRKVTASVWVGPSVVFFLSN